MSKNIQIFVVFFLIFITLVIVFWINSRDDKNLENRFKVTNALITNLEIFKGQYTLSYTFEIDKELIQETEVLNLQNTSLTFLRPLFIGKTDFIVAYDSLNFNNCRLLLSPIEYKKFKVQPDEYVISVFNKINQYRLGSTHF